MARPGLNLRDKTDPEKVLAYKAAIFQRMRLKKADGSIVPYRPHHGQKPIHFPELDDPWYRYVLCAGTRSGKTLGGASEVIVGLGMEDHRQWIVAPYYDLTNRVFDIVWEQVVENNIHGTGSVASKAYSPQSRYIKMKWGAMVYGKSADAPTSLLGEQLDNVVCDEFARFPPRIWASHLEGRLLDRKGKALFISTPRGFNQFHEFYERGFKPDFRRGGWRSARFTTPENPWIDAEWLEQQRDLMADLVWRQEYMAEFVAFAGLIFPDFRASKFPDGHLFDPTDLHIDATWTHIRAIDVGTAHPTACCWGAINESNWIHTYREYKKQDASHEFHAKNILAKTTYPIHMTVISPDAERKARNKSGRDSTIRGIYREQGIQTHLAENDWHAGLSVMTSYLRATLRDHPDQPGALISTECPMLIKELQSLEYPAGSETAKGGVPDKPRKDGRDDLPDAWRYKLMAKPQYRPPRGLSERDIAAIRKARYGYEPGRPYKPQGGAVLSLRGRSASRFGHYE